MCVPQAVILPPGGNISASGDNICTKAIKFTLQTVIIVGNISAPGNNISAQAHLSLLNKNGGRMTKHFDDLGAKLSQVN